MPVTYETIEPVENPNNFPAWSTVWLPTGPCGSRTVWHSAISLAGIPASETKYYEPQAVNEVRDDRHLSGVRNGVPPYCYTPRNVSRSTVRNHLLKRLNSVDGINLFHQYGGVLYNGSACIPTVGSVVESGGVTRVWNEVTHDITGLDTYEVSKFSTSDITAATVTVQDQLASEALTSYDVLTDIAQLRDIPRLVGHVSGELFSVLRSLSSRYSRFDLRTAASLSPARLLKNPSRILRKLGGDWLAYRYGLMPLVYSYRDIVKTTNRGVDVRGRKTAIVNARSTGVSLPPSSATYKWTEEVGTIQVSANSFQHFSTASLAQLSGLGFNPLVTAWELIPYSFVVDWFVNMGDYIARKTSQSFSGMRWACISHRSNFIKRTWVHFPNDDKTVSFSNVLPVDWWGSSPPATPSRLISRPEESQLLKEEETQSYNRWNFDLADAKLEFNPSLSWRRLIDSASLSINQLGAFNRRLRS